MDFNWHEIDRWLIGEAWVGSKIQTHLAEICERIGPRWASSEAEWQTIDYIKDQMQAIGLDHADTEAFDLQTWSYSAATANTVSEKRAIDILPFNRCPPINLQARLVDVGFGTPREIDAVSADLPGSIAIMAMAFEPFTPPLPHSSRLSLLAQQGVAAVIAIETKSGRRMEYHSASDWRDPDLNEHPVPTVVTSREHGALLRKLAQGGESLHLNVTSRFYNAPSANVAGVLNGGRWPEEHLLLGGHHDTVYGAPGGNDNATGIIAVLETARLLAGLRDEFGIAAGRSLRFVTYSGEEQKLQGSSAYVNRHYGSETPPRLAINLDELSTGHIKGLVLGFPHLQKLVQEQFDQMKDGLQCHVMAQLDPSSDHFPFLRAGIDAGHLWRWRFHSRHADAEFHHEAGDTADKVNVRELKDYAAQLARLLLRLSHVPPHDWPENPVTRDQVSARLEAERGTVVRVF